MPQTSGVELSQHNEWPEERDSIHGKDRNISIFTAIFRKGMGPVGTKGSLHKRKAFQRNTSRLLIASSFYHPLEKSCGSITNVPQINNKLREALTAVLLVKNCSPRRTKYIFKTNSHYYVSCTRLIWSKSSTYFLKIHLLLYCNVRLGLSSSFFPSSLSYCNSAPTSHRF